MASRTLLYISNYTIQVAALLSTHEAGKRLTYLLLKNLLLKCSTSKMQPMTSSLTSWQAVDQNSRQATILKFNCITRRRQWHPTPVLLPGKSHGRRSLVDCSPWGREESDTTEQLHFHFSLSCIGEGNGNPLQCSCLENPRDGGVWWAAVYGVAQSQT